MPKRTLFDYKVPQELQQNIAIGQRVRVPFGRKDRIGIVMGLSETCAYPQVKAIQQLYPEWPLPESLLQLIQWGAEYYLTPIGEALKAVLPTHYWKPDQGRRAIARPSFDAAPKLQIPTLTPAQDQALQQLRQETDKPCLLHGITGSGKTELYLARARELLQQGRSVLFLVPEIALTPQWLARCRQQLPVAMTPYHSQLTTRQREDIWQGCATGDIRAVVGTRSALFLPLENIGLIVVDEEHDSSFKQEDRFYYHARDLAIVRAQLSKAQIILGSATPALETYHHAQQGKYHYVSLKERATGALLPEVRFVSLAEPKNTTTDQEATGLISETLHQALKTTLAAGQQSLLFLNRRGYHPVQVCEDCGQTRQCPSCHISLTLHKQAKQLRCHYCFYTQQETGACLHCGSSRLLWTGWGTERVTDTVQGLFPKARIDRMDRDTISRKGTLETLLEKMQQGATDILVGTQMLVKGHDFPGVTLVGILLAESSLNFPDFRAAERTFQIITQVAGRSGRGDLPGQVLIQGFSPNHYALQHALTHNYEDFATEELQHRQALGYPPYVRLIQAVFQGKSQQTVENTAEQVANHWRQQLEGAAHILGPAPCPLEKLRDTYRHQILIKAERFAHVRRYFQYSIDDDRKRFVKRSVKLTINVDPLNLL